MLNPFLGVLLGIGANREAARAQQQQAAVARSAREAQMQEFDALRHAYTPRRARNAAMNCINCGAPHDGSSLCSYCLTERGAG